MAAQICLEEFCNWNSGSSSNKNHSIAFDKEPISNNAGAGRIAGQSTFHSIENKLGGYCEECGSEQRWDQKHDELVCTNCGLVHSEASASDVGDNFFRQYNSESWDGTLSNYSHFGNEELDRMIGSRNRRLLRETNDPEKNPALKTLKPFKLSELGANDYHKLHEIMADCDNRGEPIGVSPSQIQLDRLIKEEQSFNGHHCTIRFSFEIDPKTQKKKLRNISSEIAIPKKQQKDASKLWREQRMIECSYSKHKSDLVAGNLSQCTNRYERQIEILKSSRKIIHKETGINYKAVDRGLNRMYKKCLRRRIIESLAYHYIAESCANDKVASSIDFWLRNIFRWQTYLDLREQGQERHNQDWMKREEIVWYPFVAYMLGLPDQNICKHIALILLPDYFKDDSMTTSADSVCGFCGYIWDRGKSPFALSSMG